MKVKRVVKFNIKKSHIDYDYIKIQLIESKEIYNFANYVLRQIYFKNTNNYKYSLNFINEYPSLKELFLQYIEENKQFTSIFYKIICEYSKLKGYSINSKIVQNIVDKVKNDWTSYWALLKAKKDKTYNKEINIPTYKKKYNLVEYNHQVMSKKKLKLGYIGTDKMQQGIKIAKKHQDLNCKCFRIYEKHDKLVCELIYEKDITKVEKTDKVASIDLGLENLFTIAFNYNKKGISIKGTKIPFRKILDILKYKLEENGIECKEQEESYTSQSSYLDNDNIPTYHKGNLQEYLFSGKRITRNLYQSKQGKNNQCRFKWSIKYIEKIRRKINRRIRLSSI